MSGYLDTNIIIRYLTGDDVELAEQAAAILTEEDLILTDGVLAEAGYVLTSLYKMARVTVVDALIELVQSENIRTYPMDKSLTIHALKLCRPSGRVSFTDALLWATVRSSDTRTVYSFDRRFPNDGITLRQSP